MDQERPSGLPSAGTLIVALLAGLLVLLALFPASVATSDPPVCRAMFFYVVLCEGWIAPLVAFATAAAVGLTLWRTIDRRK